MSKYVQLGGRYWKSKTAVLHAGQKLSLDPAKTRVYFDAWATDGDKVFHHLWHRRMIDGATFVALNDIYCKDAQACYCDFEGSCKAIAGADPATFVVLDSGRELPVLGEQQDSGYAKDQQRVYFNGHVVKKAEPASFVSLGRCYGRDDDQVYFQQFPLPGATPLRWRNLGAWYSSDDDRVYYENRPIKSARPAHFRRLAPFDSEFAYDGELLFYRGELTTTDHYAQCLSSIGEVMTQRGVDYAARTTTLPEVDREYREPDEKRTYMSSVGLGEKLAKIESILGPGSPSPANVEEFFGRPFRPEEIPLAWHHPEIILICVFVGGKVSLSAIAPAE